jgi:hypothetical protein
MRVIILALLVSVGCGGRPLESEGAVVADDSCVRSEMDAVARWHDVPQSNGSWDWNCDGQAEKRIASAVNCGDSGPDGVPQSCR